MILGIVAGAAVSSGGGLIGFDNRIIASAPVWYCKHNESSGTTAVNQMGGANGTYVGTPVFGAAAIYAGGDVCWDTNNASYCGLPASLLPDPSTEFSLGILIKRKDQTGIQALIDRDPEAGNRMWQWRFNGTTLQYIKLASGLEFAPNLSGVAGTNDVVLLILTISSTGQTRQWKDDTSLDTSSLSAANFGHDVIGVNIGRRIQGDSQGNYYCAASMIWDRVVTGTEIAKFAEEAGLAP